jgi:diaminopimelate epimerase
VNFTKVQAQGNDFVFVQADRDIAGSEGDLARRVCDRHTGVGADGLVFLTPSARADSRMTIWNSDGSRAAVCGNALRCSALFGLHSVETDAGLHRLEILAGDTGAEALDVSVDMGLPRSGGRMGLDISGHMYVHTIDMGNPHAIVFADENNRPYSDSLLAAIEVHPAFPDRTNAEWVDTISSGLFRVRVWERGAGLTGACGSGACAVHAAAAARELTGNRSRITMPGGELTVTEDESGHLWLGGEVKKVFAGIWTGQEQGLP